MARMDDLFLNVLKSNPKSSVSIFYNFLLHCKTPAVIRFLSDHASLPDYLSIIASMPKLMFLRELVPYPFKQLFKHKHD